MTRLACAFTGHRPKKFPWGYNEDDPGCKRLKELLEQELLFWVQKGYTDFLSGMAEGTDTWAALMVLKLRDTYPKVKLHCILPCKSQADHWNSSAQICYRSILYYSQLELGHSMTSRQVTLRSLTPFPFIASRQGNDWGFHPPNPQPGDPSPDPLFASRL